MEDSELKRFIARLYPVVDPNGIYIVLTDVSVAVSLDKYDFCNQFCGYHSIVFEKTGNRKVDHLLFFLKTRGGLRLSRHSMAMWETRVLVGAAHRRRTRPTWIYQLMERLPFWVRT